MITPSHLIYSWALAKFTQKPVQTGEPTPSSPRTIAFVLGALLPDVPTYVFFLICGVLLGIPHDILWDDMYFNSWWSIPITLTHSFIIWPTLIAVSGYFGWKCIKWISFSALFHGVVDFFVHTEDAYRHFYPISEWKFHSPISYWNSAEYGNYVSAFDSLLVLGLLVYLYTKYNGRWRVLIISIGAIYILRLIGEPLLTNFYGS